MDRGDQRIEPNDRLRALFHEAGHIQAPAGLEEKVLARVVLVGSKVHVDQALISTRGWILIGSLLALALLVGFLAQPVQGDRSMYMFDLVGSLRIPNLMEMMTSQWVMAGIGSAAVLALLDHAIVKRFLRFSA